MSAAHPPRACGTLRSRPLPPAQQRQLRALVVALGPVRACVLLRVSSSTLDKLDGGGCVQEKTLGRVSARLAELGPETRVSGTGLGEGGRVGT
jgi:hypothetical protein